jgi:hypothetical protein
MVILSLRLMQKGQIAQDIPVRFLDSMPIQHANWFRGQPFFHVKIFNSSAIFSLNMNTGQEHK